MSTQSGAPEKKKFRLKFPHPVVLMFVIVLILSLLSWVIRRTVRNGKGCQQRTHGR